MKLTVRHVVVRSATILAVLATGCAAPAARPAAPAAPGPAAAAVSDEVRVTLLHLNDIYEITPTGTGEWGGLARVATLLAELRRENPNTFAILAGDLLSPSALGTARVDGERLQGRQMVAVLNAMGLDYATFGNHEFDLGEEAFRSRLAESSFGWISANVTAAPAAAPLSNVVSHVILRVPGIANDTFRLALFGVTMDRDAADHVRIADPVSAGVRQAELLRDSADAIVAITHMPRGQDIELVETAPQIELVVGGHDHENMLLHRGQGMVPVSRADANAKSVFVHELTWSPGSRTLQIRSTLVPVTARIAADPTTDRIALDWVRRAYSGFREAGFDPERLVARTPVPLDGLESTILSDTSALTRELAQAMMAEGGDVDGAVFNAGAIRIDDVLPPGPVSEYDVIRILPFGGPIVEIELTGALLRRVLEQGLANRGTGGYLHTAGIERAGSGWRVRNADLEDGRRYRIAIGDFLLSGREQGMDWLTRDNPELRVIRELRDVRYALIDQLARRYPAR